MCEFNDNNIHMIAISQNIENFLMLRMKEESIEYIEKI